MSVSLDHRENSATPATNTSGEGVSTFRLVLIAFALALFVRIFLVQPFNIPSASMRPTLDIGDFIYVSKTAYGYSRASLVWPLNRLPIHDRVFAQLPRRGDVVVFKNKKAGNRDYIKRVIGLPGETIMIREGRIEINGVPVRRDYLGQRRLNCGPGTALTAPAWQEVLPNGRRYIVQECSGDDGFLDTRGPYAIPSGHFFVMGDNRDQSRDSRVEASVGTVPFGDLVGRADGVFFSVDGEKGRLWQIWRWPGAIRWGRIGMGINAKAPAP